jgi:hypothetical protein
MTYEEVYNAIKDTHPNARKVIYALPDGGYAWTTYQSYRTDPDIHPFSLAWDSDCTPEGNRRLRQCTEFWQERQLSRWPGCSQ